MYLYSVASRLVNVRLDDVRVDKVRRLRESGVALSDVVRDAIDVRFDALTRRLTRGEARAIMAGVIERHPDPPDPSPRDYDVHDGRAARAAVRRVLRRRA